MTIDMTPPSWIQDMIDGKEPEPLHPDLVPHITDSFMGESLKHPLVFAVPYAPFKNANLNQMYLDKLEALRKAHRSRSWFTYIVLHERPYRYDALVSIADEMSATKYWEMLRHFWIDSENIRQNAEGWEALLRSERPGRRNMMDKHERAALAAMPEEIEIFQGHTSERSDGWSWTLDRSIAEWFGRRFVLLGDPGEPMVSTATARRADVTAYLTSRGESEILIDPTLITITNTTQISKDDDHDD